MAVANAGALVLSAVARSDAVTAEPASRHAGRDGHRTGRFALAAAGRPRHRGFVDRTANLPRERDDSFVRGRSVSMALVQAPGAIVLQQAAGHRLDPIRGNEPVR